MGKAERVKAGAHLIIIHVLERARSLALVRRQLVMRHVAPCALGAPPLLGLGAQSVHAERRAFTHQTKQGRASAADVAAARLRRQQEHLEHHLIGALGALEVKLSVAVGDVRGVRSNASQRSQPPTERGEGDEQAAVEVPHDAVVGLALRALRLVSTFWGAGGRGDSG